MSSALVRQALAFVDQEDTKVRGKKRPVKTTAQRSIGQVSSVPKKLNKKQKNIVDLPKEALIEKNIKKYLALSSPIGDKVVVDKIIERAVKGKPLADKIEVKAVEEKSILFPEDN